MNIEDRILEILMKETTSELSSEENAILVDFSSKNDSNSSFLAENRAILANFPSFEEESMSMFDVDSALSKVKSRIEDPTEKIRTLTPNKAKVSTFNFRKLAAAAVLLVGFGSLAYTFLGISSACVRYTAVDKIEEVLLPDGTEVVLNKNSALELAKHYGNTNVRAVTLQGEAFFKVKRDADQPFIVEAGDLEVEVLGTQFNIDAQKGKMTTSVFVDEGKVKVSSTKSRTKVLLTAGESTTFDNKSFALSKDNTERYNATSWMDNKLRFENTALSQVIIEIEDHFGINVELKNTALANCPYTSILNGENADEVLETLSSAFKLQLMKDGKNTFELTGGQCN